MALKERKELIEKYRDAVAYVSINNKNGDWQPDMGVAFDMLVHECYVHKGLEGRTHEYNVPEDFNWDEFANDVGI